MRKIGILGGSFDPIHLGHINLAISLQEAAGLEQVLLVPALLSPFKQDHTPLAAPEHRLHMVRLAITGMKEIGVLDWELTRPAPSYTIDTVRQLARQTPVAQLHLLLAEDHIPTFLSWKEAHSLIQLAPPLIGVRRREESFPVCPWGSLVPMPCFEISSTQVRARLKKKAYCGHLLPQAVLDYIHHHQLYASDEC